MQMGESGEDLEAIQSQIDELLHQQFKPEFLNRLDETILFASLSKEDLLEIVDIQLQQLNERLEDKKLTLHVRKSAKLFLIENGYNPSFGARPLKRSIQRNLENPLALKLLEEKYAPGDHIVVEGSENGLIFTISQKS
jgi:ATP-dependent Clp protease ATP-binding subunit ClpB